MGDGVQYSQHPASQHLMNTSYESMGATSLDMNRLANSTTNASSTNNPNLQLAHGSSNRVGSYPLPLPQSASNETVIINLSSTLNNNEDVGRVNVLNHNQNNVGTEQGPDHSDHRVNQENTFNV